MERQVRQLLGLIAVMWVAELVDFAMSGSLNGYGIVPRTAPGLLGIAFSPFLHGDIWHLIGNSVPLLFLGLLVAVGKRNVLSISAEIIVLGGLGVWVFGRGGFVHIGASGLVFGYFGYVISRAWFQRSLLSGLLALVTIASYSGLIFGVLPSARGVSWEAHLFGLIAGVLSARSGRGGNRPGGKRG